MSFISHISRKMLVNGWEGVRSFADWEAPLSAGVQPADAYKGGVSWRGLAERLSWQSFSWAQSEEQLAAAWLEHVGLEALPHSIAWPLLLIDTALLMRWEGADLGSASPPPIDAYPMFDATKGSTKGATHHEAWLPLALLMALNGEDCAPYTIFPFNMLVSSPSASAHFRLSALCSRPNFPPKASPEDKAVAEKLYGCWELVQMASNDAEFSGVKKPKGRLFYSNSYFAAQVTNLKGWFHFGYSGMWHIEDGQMYHVCLCNSPMACFEVLKDSGKGLEASETPRQSYGGVRTRTAKLIDDNTLQLTVAGRQSLTWKKVPQFNKESGGRWASSWLGS